MAIIEFRNLTTHVIRIRNEDSDQASPLESDLVLEAEKLPLRIQEVQDGAAWIPDGSNIPVRTTQLGEIEGLPDEEDDVILIVSMPTAERAYALGRRDVVAPDTGKDAIRFKLPNGSEGIYAVRGLRYIDGGK